MIHWCTKITRDHRWHPPGPNDQFSQEDKHEAVVQRFEHTLNVLNRSGFAHRLMTQVMGRAEFFLENKTTTSKADGTGSFPPLETPPSWAHLSGSVAAQWHGLPVPVPTSLARRNLLQEISRKVSKTRWGQWHHDCGVEQHLSSGSPNQTKGCRGAKETSTALPYQSRKNPNYFPWSFVKLHSSGMNSQCWVDSMFLQKSFCQGARNAAK